jgi:hypothetical protein
MGEGIFLMQRTPTFSYSFLTLAACGIGEGEGSVLAISKEEGREEVLLSQTFVRAFVKSF